MPPRKSYLMSRAVLEIIRIVCLDLTENLSEYLFRCLNSNDSHSLMVIKPMLSQVGKALFTASAFCLQFLGIFLPIFSLILIPINHILLQAPFLRWQSPSHSPNQLIQIKIMFYIKMFTFATQMCQLYQKSGRKKLE